MLVRHAVGKDNQGAAPVHRREDGGAPAHARPLNWGKYWWHRLGLVLQDARGATTAEYALLLALVVIVLIGTLTGLGDVLNNKINSIISEIGDAG